MVGYKWVADELVVDLASGSRPFSPSSHPIQNDPVRGLYKSDQITMSLQQEQPRPSSAFPESAED